jgi:hypothetical protein
MSGGCTIEEGHRNAGEKGKCSIEQELRLTGSSPSVLLEVARHC